MKPEVIPEWLGNLFKSARLEWRLRLPFASDAAGADTSCSEQVSGTPGAELAGGESERCFSTGADAASAPAPVESDTETGRPANESSA